MLLHHGGRSFSTTTTTTTGFGQQQQAEEQTEHYQSPLDRFLDPSTPTPLFESTQALSAPPTANRRLLECGLDESRLKFKTKCYGRLLQAPFVHPNEHKVVLSVALDDLPLTTQLERDICLEIVGPQRWQHEKGELRLSSVSFASRIENKRHLVSMLDKLVLQCQRLAAQVVEQGSQAVA